jgi:hypothetical protein
MATIPVKNSISSYFQYKFYSLLLKNFLLFNLLNNKKKNNQKVLKTNDLHSFQNNKKYLNPYFLMTDKFILHFERDILDQLKRSILSSFINNQKDVNHKRFRFMRLYHMLFYINRKITHYKNKISVS